MRTELGDAQLLQQHRQFIQSEGRQSKAHGWSIGRLVCVGMGTCSDCLVISSEIRNMLAAKIENGEQILEE